jgi:hypothetical protein
MDTGRTDVWSRHPVPRHRLDDATEPQPDIVLVRPLWRGYPTAHPRPGEIFLVIARAGIPEFWIVDLTTDGVLVCPNPGGDRYGSMTRVEPSGVLEVEALAGVTIPAAALFV